MTDSKRWCEQRIKEQRIIEQRIMEQRAWKKWQARTLGWHTHKSY